VTWSETLKAVFKGKWTVSIVEAPPFAWLAAAILLAGTLIFLFWLWWLVRRERGIHSRIVTRLSEIKARESSGPAGGLSAASFDAVAQIFEKIPSLKARWTQFSAQTIVKPTSSGEDRFWAAESAEQDFSEANVIGPRINRSLFLAVPGIVTGVGLLCTFVAILVALLDVRLVDNRVQGLELLIQGLSGKFLSSIAALLAATIYVIFEKSLLHRLGQSYHAMVASLDDLIPVLSPTRVLCDLNRDIAEQSAAFRSFNADLSLKLRQSFSESMTPTLGRMVTAVEDLNQLLRAAEAQKQESITGSIERLLTSLQQSLNGAIRDMGAQFSTSLSGSTISQFEDLSKSLGGTVRLLEGMNTQFESNRSSFNELVTFVQNSTFQQMELGKSQVQELTDVLKAMMSQMGESTGTSVNQMAATMVRVAHDLTTKVSDLGEQVTRAMADSAGKAAQVASDVIDKADTWSSASVERLEQILSRHQVQLTKVEELRGLLDQSLLGYQSTLQNQSKMSQDLGQLISQLGTISSSVAMATKSMKETQDGAQRVSSQASTVMERLQQANLDQQAVWKQIHGNMEQYRKVFVQVEEAAAKLLSQVGEHLNNLIGTSRQGFEGLIKISDEHFSTAVQRLGSTVNELEQYLEELSEVIGRATVRK